MKIRFIQLLFGLAVTAFFYLFYVSPEIEFESAINEGNVAASLYKVSGNSQDLSTPQSVWRYSKKIDPLTNSEGLYAYIEAGKSLNFGFPYDGYNIPRLIILHRPAHDTEVILQIDQGEFLCLPQNCHVSIVFDGKQPQHFMAAAPQDGTTTFIYFEQASAIISKIETAKTTKIEAMFYKEGSSIMEFNTAGLNWK